MTTKPEMSDQELIEKTQLSIRFLSNSTHQYNTGERLKLISNFTDLLSRFEKAQKENEELKTELNFKNVTRIEVVNHHCDAEKLGRVFYFHKFDMNVFTAIQDEGRTLKLFIENTLPNPPKQTTNE